MKTVTNTLACIATAAAALVAATATNAASIVNGDFEGCSPSCPVNQTPLSSGGGQLTGWTVSSGNGGNANQAAEWVSYADGGWQAASGNYSIALSGGYQGTVSQTITTVAGSYYDVSFEVSGNPKNIGLMKTIGVQLNNNPFSQFTFKDESTSSNDMVWITENYIFKATSTSSTLSFFNYNPSVTHVGNKFYGLGLDDVNIAPAAAPEPATWAMMILGMAGIGGAVRSRRRFSLAA